jgi:glycosyltransferase involved in cell wall biosynthesis
MKILHTIPYFLPARVFGGPVYATYYLCRELIKRGHEVVVFTTNILSPAKIQKDFRRKELIDGILVRRFGISAKFMSYYITPSMLYKMLAERADIIHTHGYRNFQVDASAIYSFLKRTPLVLHPRGMAIPTAGIERGSRVGNIIYRAYDLATMQFSLRKANKIIATTRYEKRLLSQLNFLKEKIEVVPHGVDVEKFKRDEGEGQQFRERYHIEGKILLYVGRIDKGKNIEALLRAARAIKEKISIVIVGEEVPSTQIRISSFKDILAKYSKKLGLGNVIFTGGLYGEDLIAAYSAADIFVNPSMSKAENFGMVNLEAAACSLPVVAASVGVAPDLLRDNRELLFTSERELVEILSRLLEDEDLCKKIGKELRRKVEMEYSWSEVAENVEKIYRGLF